MDPITAVINGITTAVSSGNQATATKAGANAQSRQSATMYRMLPLIILAAVVLIMVIYKK